MKNRRVYKVLLCGIVFLFFLFAFVGCEALFGNNIQEDVNVKLTLSNYDEYSPLRQEENRQEQRYCRMLRIGK